MSYLFAAYSAIWILLFAYIFNLARRLGRVRDDLAHVRDLLDQEKK